MNLHLIRLESLLSAAVLRYTDSLDLVTDHDSMSLKINQDFKKSMFTIISDEIQNESIFGKTTVIVCTCRPKFNWRNAPKKYTDASVRYSINTEEYGIHIDSVAFDSFVDTCIASISKSSYPIIKSDIIDSCDIIKSIKHMTHHKFISESPSKLRLVSDNNIGIFLHQDKQEISWINTEIEKNLIAEGLR